MSLETWKQEFYPKPASETTPEEAVQHSLTKWEGLLPENLAKHNVRVDGMRRVVGGEDEVGCISIASETCSLCFHHFGPEKRDQPQCGTCPLFQIRGTPCDRMRNDEVGKHSPWGAFSYTRNPEPMIEWLVSALDYQIRN